MLGSKAWCSGVLKGYTPSYPSRSFRTRPYIIATRACYPFGWDFSHSGGYEGSRLEVPGMAGFKLRHGQGHAHAHLDLVRTPYGVTIKSATNRKHDSLRVYSFIVASGAESSLVREADRTSCRVPLNMLDSSSSALVAWSSRLGVAS